MGTALALATVFSMEASKAVVLAVLVSTCLPANAGGSSAADPLAPYKDKWSLCAHEVMAEPVTKDGKTFVNAAPEAKLRSKCDMSRCRPKGALKSLFNNGDVTPSERMVERFWMEAEYNQQAATEANKVEGAGGRYDKVASGVYMLEDKPARKFLLGWAQEKFCQIDCGLHYGCMDPLDAVQLVKDAGRDDGFSSGQGSGADVTTATASPKAVPTGLIVAKGKPVILTPDDSDVSCERRVKCAMNKDADTCSGLDKVKDAEQQHVVQTLVGQTLKFIEDLDLKPRDGLLEDEKAAAESAEVIAAVDEKFVIQRVCAFLEPKEKAELPRQIRAKKDWLKNMYETKSQCIREGSTDFECDSQLNKAGAAELFDLKSDFLASGSSSAKGDFLLSVVDKFMSEVERLFDAKGPLTLKRTPECTARLYSEEGVRYLSVNSVSAALPRCSDILLFRTDKGSPHSCDVARQGQEALGFMKNCPFKGSGGKSRMKVCEAQLSKLLGVMGLSLPGQVQDDYTIGSEFAASDDETPSGEQPIMPKGSKIFAEVKSYAMQIKSLLSEFTDACIEGEMGNAFSVISPKPSLGTAFTAQYMCRAVLKC